jgi:hypothetical protein
MKPLAWLAWADYQAFMDRAIEAAEAPPASARLELAALASELGQSQNPVTRVLGTDMGKYLVRHHLGLCSVDLLQAVVSARLYRLREDRWPTADELDVPRAAPEAVLTLTPDGDALELTVEPAVHPDSSEDEPLLSLRLEP